MYTTRLIRVSVLLLALAASALSASVRIGHTADAASAPRPPTVQAALSLCRHHRAPARPVTVTGYFRSGPVLNGPIVLIGGLFERNTVSISAAKSLDALLRYHGLGFSIDMTSRLSRSPVLDKVRDYRRVFVTGRLNCFGWSGVQPTAIRVAPTR